MADSTEVRIRRLEGHVNLLAGVAIIQSILLSGMAPTLLAGLILLLPVLALTHQHLPRLARWMGHKFSSRRHRFTTAQRA